MFKNTLNRKVWLLIAVALFALTGCGKKYRTVLVDVVLIQDPGAPKVAYVPNSLLKRGEFVIEKEKKSVNGKDYLMVQIDGVDTSGWVEERYTYPEKLTSQTVTEDADLFVRPHPQSPKYGRAKAGQKVFVLEQKDSYSLIQYPGVKAYIKSNNLGKENEAVKTVSMPGFGSASISASSQLVRGVGKELEFDPRNLFDKSLQTAWCEGKSGEDGLGESITLNFTENITISKISIVNGWAKSEDTYKDNNRVAKLKVTGGNGNEVSIDLQDENYDYQDFPVDGAVILTGTSFKFTIDDVYKGKKRNTCISEIKLETNRADQNQNKEEPPPEMEMGE